MKILIYDDEERLMKNVSECVRSYLAEKYRGASEVIGLCNEDDLFSRVNAEKFDVYFLDICSGADEMFGIKAAKKIRELNREAHIVFITAFEQYRQTAIDELIRPSGYIEKGDTERCLKRTLDKIISERSGENLSIYAGKGQFVPLENILYISYNPDTRRAEIHMKNGVHCVTKPVIQLISGSEKEFIQLNRGIVAAKGNIIGSKIDYSRGRILYSDGSEIKLSRGGLQNLREYINEQAEKRQ